MTGWYVIADLNTTLAAERPHVHVSTGRYRLARAPSLRRSLGLGGRTRRQVVRRRAGRAADAGADAVLERHHGPLLPDGDRGWDLLPAEPTLLIGVHSGGS